MTYFKRTIKYTCPRSIPEKKSVASDVNTATWAPG